MKALITGGTGFVGRHLAKHLVECGDDVIVTDVQGKGGSVARDVSMKSSSISNEGGEIALHRSVQKVFLDITERQSVESLISLTQPDVVYHLAALSSVSESNVRPLDFMNVNAMGSICLFEALRQFSPRSKLLYVSSSEVYGCPRPGSLPLTETAELRPVNYYALSKATADLAAFQFFFRDRLDIVRVRPFPHTGPGQRPIFALSSFACQIAKIKLGLLAPKLRVGNLEVKRDYTDVADIVIGYREALLNGKKGGVYNLCSGNSYTLSDVVNLLTKIAGVEVEIEVDESKVRAVEITESYGSNQLAHKELGWKPRIELDGILHGLFAYWVESLDR